MNNQYTKFTLGRFNKDLKTFPGDGIIGVSDYDDHIKGSPALSAKHIVGYAYGGHRPHSELEHVANPNAIVIRGPHGIEVLSLLSGQPITRLEVTETKDILMDIDGDGEMEQLVWDLGHVSNKKIHSFHCLDEYFMWITMMEIGLGTINPIQLAFFWWVGVVLIWNLWKLHCLLMHPTTYGILASQGV